MHEHLRHPQAVLGDDRLDLERHLAAQDQADVEGGAADVGADHVRLAVEAAEVLAAEDAAGRARVERDDRPLRGVEHGCQAAARLHHEQRLREALVAQARLERLEVADDLRADVCGDRRRRGALVLAEHRRDLVRVGGEDAAGALGEQLLDAPLVASR